MRVCGFVCEKECEKDIPALAHPLEGETHLRKKKGQVETVCLILTLSGRMRVCVCDYDKQREESIETMP